LPTTSRIEPSDNKHSCITVSLHEKRTERRTSVVLMSRKQNGDRKKSISELESGITCGGTEHLSFINLRLRLITSKVPLRDYLGDVV